MNEINNQLKAYASPRIVIFMVYNVFHSSYNSLAVDWVDGRCIQNQFNGTVIFWFDTEIIQFLKNSKHCF